jgi:D-alanine-D-alanine ligase
VALPYNGSQADSSQTTINKFETLQQLKAQGMTVTQQFLLEKSAWLSNKELVLSSIKKKFRFPLIAKPVDDGCSSAVKKIKTDDELIAFAEMMFREKEELLHPQYELLHLKPKEEFPRKDLVLIESLIQRETASILMEVTVGLLTHYTEDGSIMYEIFEPSETLSDGDVLSLEEKFLAGQGQNITPARFGKTAKEYKLISNQVKKAIQDAAITLKIQGYARLDAFVRIYDDLRTETIVIEANSLPGMTPATCIYHQAAIAGYKPYDFIDKILSFGQQRKLKASQ